MRQVVFCTDSLRDGVCCRSFDTTFASMVLVDYFRDICDLVERFNTLPYSSFFKACGKR
jgi:hypothetical protein